MKPRVPTYEHRVAPETRHKIVPVRDWMSKNPNKCDVCGMAILRVTGKQDEPEDET
jgi:hypothetical protein